jgi:hypothetical protein
MHRETKTIFEQYKIIKEQRVIKIGNETINVDMLISDIDKSSDLPINAKNSIKSIIMSKMASGNVPQAPTPSAMSPSQPQPLPNNGQRMPMAMI